MWTFPQSHHPLALIPNEDIPNNEVHDTTRTPCTDPSSSLHHPLKATAELSSLTLLTSLLRHPPGSPGDRGASTKITHSPSLYIPLRKTECVQIKKCLKTHGIRHGRSSNRGARLTSTQWSKLMPCGSLQVSSGRGYKVSFGNYSLNKTLGRLGSCQFINCYGCDQKFCLRLLVREILINWLTHVMLRRSRQSSIPRQSTNTKFSFAGIIVDTLGYL